MQIDRRKRSLIIHMSRPPACPCQLCQHRRSPFRRLAHYRGSGRGKLVGQLCELLEARGQGARRLDLHLQRVDSRIEVIRIAGIQFRVVGVSKKRGSAFGSSQDGFAVIPLGAYMRLFGARHFDAMRADLKRVAAGIDVPRTPVPVPPGLN